MSNLLEKASILTTPTAYNDGKLLSVKPAPYLGSELVTNGTFDTDSDWNKQTSNWTIVNGYAVCDGLQTSNSSLFQDLAVVNGSRYRIDFTITNSLNNLNLILGATTIGQYGSGTHSVYVTKDSNASARIFFQATASNNFSGSLDNVSVKEVIDGDFDFTRNSSATRVASNGLIEDVASGLSRIDYTDGVGHILLEPQSTNAAIYSGNASQWVFGGSGNTNNTTRVDNQSSPDGETNASLFSRNTGTSGWFGTGNLSSTNGQTYTHSLFVKKGTSSTVIIKNVSNSPQSSVTYNIDTDTFTVENNATGNSLNYGNGWYRVEMTFEYTNATGSSSQIRHILEDGKSMYVFGAQLEQLPYATSYIPTSGSTFTRLGETLNNAGSSDLINSTEGVLYAEIAALANSGNSRFISLSDGTNQNIVLLGYISTDNRIRIFIKSANSTSTNNTSTTVTATNFNKIAIKYKENNFALWVNGTETFSDTSGLTPIGLNQLEFEFGSASKFEGKVKTVAVFKEALTDAELTCLTTI